MSEQKTATHNNGNDDDNNGNDDDNNGNDDDNDSIVHGLHDSSSSVEDHHRQQQQLPRVMDNEFSDNEMDSTHHHDTTAELFVSTLREGIAVATSRLNETDSHESDQFTQHWELEQWQLLQLQLQFQQEDERGVSQDKNSNTLSVDNIQTEEKKGDRDNQNESRHNLCVVGQEERIGDPPVIGVQSTFPIPGSSDLVEDSTDEDFESTVRPVRTNIPAPESTIREPAEREQSGPFVWTSARMNSRRHKSEIGLEPGQPIPGAYEAVPISHARSDQGGDHTTYNNESNIRDDSRNVDDLGDRRDVSGQDNEVDSNSPPSAAVWVHSLETRVITDNTLVIEPDRCLDGSEHDRINSTAESSSKTTGCRGVLSSKLMRVVMVGVVVLALSVLVMMIASNKQTTNKPIVCEYDAASVDTGDNIALQCECNNRIDSLPNETRILYDDIMENVYRPAGLDPSDFGGVSSCSERNLQLLQAIDSVRNNPNDSLRDRFLLSTIYLRLGGKDWTSSEGWLTPSSICDWDRIYCLSNSDGPGSSNHTVTALDFNNIQLNGPMPEELFLFEDLRKSVEGKKEGRLGRWDRSSHMFFCSHHWPRVHLHHSLLLVLLEPCPIVFIRIQRH